MPNSAYYLLAPLATGPLKPVVWIGSALEDLRALADESRGVFGCAIHVAQLGSPHRAAKRMQGEFGGLVEVVDDFDGSTFRAIYTAKLAGRVYVLHVFRKKSTRWDRHAEARAGRYSRAVAARQGALRRVPSRGAAA